MNLNELINQRDHHEPQILYPHEDIINLSVNFFTKIQTGKETFKTATDRQQFIEYSDRAGLKIGNKPIWAYQELVNFLKKYEEEDV